MGKWIIFAGISHSEAIRMIPSLKRKLTLYNIDILNTEYISGWCFHRLLKQSPVCLSFIQCEKQVGETRCDLFREDLKALDLHPTGYCGFEYVFDKSQHGLSADPLSIHINGAKTPVSIIDGSQILNVFQPQHPMFFMHIPKTAGTSFNNYIRQYFGYQKSHTHIESIPFDRQKLLANTCDYLSGHLTLEHIPKIFQQQDAIHLHTIIRQPLRQLHSHIAWVKGIALDTESLFFKKHHTLIQTMGRDLFEVDLSDPVNLKTLVNNLDGFQLDFFDNIQTRYFLDYRPDRVSQQDCDNAMANIAQFKTIGLTESFNQYTAEFCDFYGIQQKPITSVHNPAKVTPLFDVNQTAIRDAIMPLVQFDLQLYDEIAFQKQGG